MHCLYRFALNFVATPKPLPQGFFLLLPDTLQSMRLLIQRHFLACQVSRPYRCCPAFERKTQCIPEKVLFHPSFSGTPESDPGYLLCFAKSYRTLVTNEARQVFIQSCIIFYKNRAMSKFVQYQADKLCVFS